jgi:hypothetical protein
MRDGMGIKSKSEKSESRGLLWDEGGRMVLKLMFIEQVMWCGLDTSGCEWNLEAASGTNC